MAKLRKLLDATFVGEVPAASVVEHELGDIPVGKRWRVMKLGASQFASGSNVSARAQLQVKVGSGDWEPLREIALSTSTYELPIEVDIAGPVDEAADTISVRVTRENGPGQPREIMAWITGYEF